MHCISNHLEVPLHNQTFKQPDKCKGNASKAIKANNPKGKDLARHHSTPPLHQKHGTINQFQWTSTKPEHQEGIGEVGEEVRKGET